MIYIFGHKIPDTDTICSSIVYANYLKSRGMDVEAIRLGELNNETKFLLEKIGVQAPALKTSLEDGSQIILVDHNEKSQTIDNIDNLELVGLVDHHKIGNLSTSAPVSIRIQPLCSTASVLFEIFEADGYQIPLKDAKLMMAAIISDSLLFKSPTSTQKDKEILEKLNDIANIDSIEDFAMEMFFAKSDLGDISAEELIKIDYKEFDLNGHKSGIGVIETVNPGYALGRKAEILQGMQKIKSDSNLDSIFLSVIDILKEENFTIVLGDTEAQIINDIYGKATTDNVAELGNVLSRKKQIVPQFTDYFNKK